MISAGLGVFVVSAIPQAASAATIEISGSGADSATCGAASSPCRTLGFVLGQRVTPEPDLIQLQAGDYATPGLSAGPDSAGDTIRGGTLIHDDNGADALLSSGTALRLENVTLKLPAGLSPARYALSLAAGSALKDVTVDVANASSAASQVAAGGAGLSFEHLTVAGNHTGDALTLDAPVGALVIDSTLQGGSTPAANALYVGNGDARVMRSRLNRDATAPGLDAVVGAINARLVIDSTLITGGRTGVNAQAEPGHDGVLTVRGSTVDIATPGADDSGTDRASVHARTTMPGVASQLTHVQHSILVEQPYAFQESGALATVDCSDSLVPASANPLIACGADAGNEAPTGALFANAAAGDYHPVAGSPAVDGATAALGSDEPATDLDGNPRVADGDGDCSATVDRGAYEAAGRPCVVVAPALPVVDQVSLSRSHLRLRLSVDATVTVTVARLLRKGRTAKAKTLRFTARAGRTRRAFSSRQLRPGRYRLTVVATAAGGRSAPKRISFTVRAR